MRILIIEDDPDIRQFLRYGLEAEAFTIDEAPDGERGSYIARTNEYDVIILDHLLPKKDGCDVCKELRCGGNATPIIIISVNATAENKVHLLQCGADDYLVKPFAFDELLARIRAILRRPRTIMPDICEVDDLTLDSTRQKVTRGNQDIYLTRKEFSLLEYLIKNQGNVVSRGMLMEHVWNADSDPFSNTIEAHILNVRKKIDAPKKRKLIHTIPGRGYKLDLVG